MKRSAKIVFALDDIAEETMRYWRNDLERRLDKALLTERQKQIANALLQFNGCAYQTRREMYQALFRAETSPNSASGIVSSWWEKGILPKIVAGLELSDEEWAILLRFDPWWREFVRVMGRCAVHEVIARKERVTVSMLTRHEIARRRRFSMDIETRLRRCELTAKQERVADAVFGLDERFYQDGWTIFSLTRLIVMQDPEADRRKVWDRRSDTKQALAAVQRKVLFVLTLPLHERAILARIIPWYGRFFAEYSGLTPEAANYMFARCVGQSGRPSNAGFAALTLWRYEVKRLEACNDEDIIKAARELSDDGQIRLFNRGLQYIEEAARTLLGLGIIYGFTLEDLIQEGAIGWWSAWQEWTGGDAATFRQYVIEVVRSSCRAAFAHPSRRSPLSDNDRIQVRKLVKTAVEYRRTCGVEPPLPKLREMMGWTPEEFRKVQDLTRLYWRTFIYLSAPASKAEESEGKPRTKEEVIPSNAPTPEEALIAEQRAVAQQMIADFVDGAVEEVLTPIEQFVLQLRFGFDPDCPDGLLLEEIAEEFDVPEGELVSIEDDALIKLRSHPQLLERYKVSMRMLRATERLRPPPPSYGIVSSVSPVQPRPQGTDGASPGQRHQTSPKVARTLKEQLEEWLAARRKEPQIR